MAAVPAADASKPLLAKELLSAGRFPEHEEGVILGIRLSGT